MFLCLEVYRQYDIVSLGIKFLIEQFYDPIVWESLGINQLRIEIGV